MDFRVDQRTLDMLEWGLLETDFHLRILGPGSRTREASSRRRQGALGEGILEEPPLEHIEGTLIDVEIHGSDGSGGAWIPGRRQGEEDVRARIAFARTLPQR